MLAPSRAETLFVIAFAVSWFGSPYAVYRDLRIANAAGASIRNLWAVYAAVVPYIIPLAYLKRRPSLR